MSEFLVPTNLSRTGDSKDSAGLASVGNTNMKSLQLPSVRDCTSLYRSTSAHVSSDNDFRASDAENSESKRAIQNGSMANSFRKKTSHPKISSCLKMIAAASSLACVPGKSFSTTDFVLSPGAAAASNDLLGGKGQFTTMENFESSWKPSSSLTVEAYDFQVKEEALSLAKKETAKANFDDGVVFDLPIGSRPRHLQFSCMVKGDGEGCDVRLAKRVSTNYTWTQTELEEEEE